MPTAHCVATTEGVILTFDHNFCRLMGRSREDLIGRSYRTLTAAHDLDRSSQMLGALVDRASPTRFKKHYVRPDGNVVTADLLVSSFKEEDRLVTTLSWHEAGDTDASPRALWKMAHHVRHIHACHMQAFGADLFGDFVGVIMLHAYLAEAEGRRVSIEEIAASSGLHVGTIGRWVGVLRQRSLIAQPDLDTAAIQLSHQGMMAMEKVLATAAAYSPD